MEIASFIIFRSTNFIKSNELRRNARLQFRIKRTKQFVRRLKNRKKGESDIDSVTAKLWERYGTIEISDSAPETRS